MWTYNTVRREGRGVGTGQVELVAGEGETAAATVAMR